MKAPLLALSLALSLSAAIAQQTVNAHSAHGVDEPAAMTIVRDTVPLLTTKDLGFEVGQLDTSWNSLTEDDIALIETDGDFYVMSATNPESGSAIFFLIGINGQILDVNNSNDF